MLNEWLCFSANETMDITITTTCYLPFIFQRLGKLRNFRNKWTMSMRRQYFTLSGLHTSARYFVGWWVDWVWEMTVLFRLLTCVITHAKLCKSFGTYRRANNPLASGDTTASNSANITGAGGKLDVTSHGEAYNILVALLLYCTIKPTQLLSHPKTSDTSR